LDEKRNSTFHEASSDQLGPHKPSGVQSEHSRLAAIVAADVVGYTRLMEHDTAGTVAAWQAARDTIIDPKVAEYEGRVVKLTGDGFLAEFSTAQAAVECAISVQEQLRGSSLDFRIGVSIGDIVDDGRDIYGEGINIAARLESISAPGGILISGEIHNLVRNRIDETFLDMGRQQVKHVSQPVRCFALGRFSIPEFETISPDGVASPLGSVGGKSLKYAGAAVVTLLVVSGLWLLMPKVSPEAPRNKPSIVSTAEDATSLGESFRDCKTCPIMMVLQPGSFKMGWGKGDPDEKPVHDVTLSKKIAVGKFEVTFNDWEHCVSDGGCASYQPDDMGWGRNHRPVINVSWLDAQAYVAWLRKKTGKKYRLLTEAEWEYAARGGRSTMYPWGYTIDAAKANYGLFRNKTTPVGFYDPNGFGLHDVIGNVWEWVTDCYAKDAYSRHHTYPLPSLDDSETCRRVVRGGSWNVDMSDGPNLMRVSIRWRAKSNSRYNHFGFRVARDQE
jgi:formylglycine-generating enzyme required for sulfatase activity